MLQPTSADNKTQPVKRTKEDNKEPEKKKIRKRSVKGSSTAVKMSHASTSNYVNNNIVQLFMSTIMQALHWKILLCRTCGTYH